MSDLFRIDPSLIRRHIAMQVLLVNTASFNFSDEQMASVSEPSISIFRKSIGSFIISPYFVHWRTFQTMSQNKVYMNGVTAMTALRM
jgi:hypothetical protein